MWRLMNMTFYGKSRVSKEVESHIHESPASMTMPLTLLAIGSVLAGWLGVPKLWNIFGEGCRSFESLAGSRVCIRGRGSGQRKRARCFHGMDPDGRLGGLRRHWHRGGALFLPSQAAHSGPLEKSLKPLHGLLYNKWYVDEIYDFLFVNGLCKGGGRVLGAFDRNVVDGGVNGAGWLTRFSSRVSMWWDKWVIDGAVRFSSFFVNALLPGVHPANRPRAGLRVFIVVGVLVFLGYYVAR